MGPESLHLLVVDLFEMWTIRLNLYLQTPLFLWESLYDSYQLAHSYREPCKEVKCATKHGIDTAKSIFNLWDRLPNSGGFLSGCVHHCEDSSVGDVAHFRPIHGDTPLQ